MERKIVFRGKRKDTGEWVYGSFLQDDYSNCCIVEFVDHHEQWHDVNPKTLGQFTGLYDKDGKEIYEGDIVKFRVLDDTIGEDIWKEYESEVSFCNGCFCTYDTPLIQGKWKGHNMVNVEIIGNIHDTPNC